MVIKLTKKLGITLLVLAILAVSAMLILHFRSESEEQKIKRTFTELADSIRKTQDEGLLTEVGNAKGTGKFFCEEITVKVREGWASGTHSKKELQSKIMLGRKQFRNLEVSFYDIEPSVADNRAEVTFTAMLNGVLAGRGDTVREVRDFRATLVKNDDLWQIERVEVNEILKK